MKIHNYGNGRRWLVSFCLGMGETFPHGHNLQVNIQSFISYQYILHTQVLLYTSFIDGRLEGLRLQVAVEIFRKTATLFLGQSPAFLSLTEKKLSSL